MSRPHGARQPTHAKHSQGWRQLNQIKPENISQWAYLILSRVGQGALLCLGFLSLFGLLATLL